MTPLEKLGSDIAATQQDILAERNDLHQVRSRLLHPVRRPRTLFWSVPALATALAVAVGVVLYSWLRPTPPPVLSYTIDYGSAPVGHLPTRLSDEARVTFSDGTTVKLLENSSGNLERVSPDGTRISLHHGRALLDVVPHPGRQWDIMAGPYHLRVLGTKFVVGWDRDKRELTVSMAEGVVRVSGEGLGPQVVGAGESLRVWADEGGTYTQRGAVSRGIPRAETEPARSENVPAETEPARSENVPAGAPGNGDPRQREPASPDEDRGPVKTAPRLSRHASRGTPANPVANDPPGRTTSVPPGATSAVRTWEDLARQGNYRDAFSLADQLGWDELVADGTEGQLGTLADLARLAGRSARAAAAYRRLREHFPGTEGAADAAFHLGRLGAHAPDGAEEAARWFRSYLAEQPNGPFAREALGRLLESYLAAGDISQARATASQYLSRYPEGPRAAEARALVTE